MRSALSGPLECESTSVWKMTWFEWAFCMPLKPFLSRIWPVARSDRLILAQIVVWNVAFWETTYKLGVEWEGKTWFSIWEQLLHRNVQRFRGGLAFKAHRLCVSLNSRLESNKADEESARPPPGYVYYGCVTEVLCMVPQSVLDTPCLVSALVGSVQILVWNVAFEKQCRLGVRF